MRAGEPLYQRFLTWIPHVKFRSMTRVGKIFNLGFYTNLKRNLAIPSIMGQEP